jgi:hypothetical protein
MNNLSSEIFDCFFSGETLSNNDYFFHSFVITSSRKIIIFGFLQNNKNISKVSLLSLESTPDKLNSWRFNAND